MSHRIVGGKVTVANRARQELCRLIYEKKETIYMRWVARTDGDADGDL